MQKHPQKHCIRIARLYKLAAKIIENVCKTGESVKSIVYRTKHPNTKGLFALVVETLKHSRQIEFLLKRTKLLEKETGLDPWLAKVLITELLWGKQYLLGESRPIKTILAYQQVLNAHASDVHENYSTEIKVTKPRFVRINTLLTSVKDAVDGFRDEGWTFVRYTDTKNYDGFLDKVANLSESEFMVDMHIPELLIFPQNTEFYSHYAYKQGLIILQDKASCLPGHLLNPSPGSAVLDMCAAPGMKTSHLAAKLKNEGKIFAVDLNGKRLKTLETLMEKNGITCVQTINKDILNVTNSNCPEVKYILVDPSCSGSGMVDRLDLVGPTIKDDRRIKKLQGFQIMILKHALRRFPNAQRVIYSTCSLYPEENEEVVEDVIKQTAKFKLVKASELLKTPWNNFGSEDYGDIGKSCLYSRPEKDLTNGFFVAVFERLMEGEVNEYYVPYDKMRNENGAHIENDGMIDSNKDGNPGNKFKRKNPKKYEANNTEESKKNFYRPYAPGGEYGDEKILSSTKIDVKNHHEDSTFKRKKKNRKNRNIEDKTHVLPEGKTKKKEKKHNLERDNNEEISKDNIEGALHDDKSEMSKSKKKKRKTEDSKIEELNTDGSFLKKKRKKRDGNSSSNGDENDDLSNLLITEAINNILRKNEEMEKSEQKKNKMEKKDNRRVDVDFNDQDEIVENLNDSVNIPGKRKRKKGTLDSSTNETLNTGNHREESKKSKKGGEIIGKDTQKAPCENDGNVVQNWMSNALETSKEKIEEFEKIKKKKHKRSMSNDNEGKHIQNAMVNVESATNSSSKKKASKIEDAECSFQDNRVKKKKKRRQSTVLDES